MAAAGQNFNETVEVAELPLAVSQALIAAASNVPGHTVMTAGAGSIIVTRRYTPTWAIVVGVLGLLVFLLGVAALLYKVTETLTFTFAPLENGGTRVQVSGVGTPEMFARTGSVLAAMPRIGYEVDPIADIGVPESKVCPNCAETIKSAARICRYCKTVLSPDAIA